MDPLDAPHVTAHQQHTLMMEHMLDRVNGEGEGVNEGEGRQVDDGQVAMIEAYNHIHIQYCDGCDLNILKLQPFLQQGLPHAALPHNHPLTQTILIENVIGAIV